MSSLRQALVAAGMREDVRYERKRVKREAATGAGDTNARHRLRATRRGSSYSREIDEGCAGMRRAALASNVLYKCHSFSLYSIR